MRHYKAQCVTRYDDVVADSTTADELLDAFAAKLVETLRDEAPMHRLWYDLRTQCMFEEQLREAVLDDRRHARADDLAGRQPLRRAGRPAAARSTPAAAYGLLDGVFQQALLGHLTGNADRPRRPGRPGARPDAADAGVRLDVTLGYHGRMRRILLLT